MLEYTYIDNLDNLMLIRMILWNELNLWFLHVFIEMPCGYCLKKYPTIIVYMNFIAFSSRDYLGLPITIIHIDPDNSRDVDDGENTE